MHLSLVRANPRLAIAGLAVLLGCCPSGAQEAAAGFPVRLSDEILFQVHSRYGRNSAEDRAMLASQHLLRVAKDRQAAVDSIRTEEQPGATEVLLGEQFLFAITDEDAAAVRRARQDLVRERVELVKRSIQRYRDERSWRNLLQGLLLAVLLTVLAILCVRAIGWLYARFHDRLLLFMAARPEGLRFHASQLLSARQITHMLIGAALAVRWFLYLALLQLWIVLTLSLFPGTAALAKALTGFIWAPVHLLWTQTLTYLPNLFFVLVIAVVTFYASRLNDFLFQEIAEGRIRPAGFYPDWALPTSRLVRLLIIAAGLVAAFPYLPGSESPAFRGISIFLGVLFSLGSTSAVANIVAGVIITYMRPFHVGDRVKIAETTGDVLEKTLLVTRIRSIKNVVITIPNANVLSSQILNFTVPARESRLILHTEVTIGYDAPWRQVHELLIKAAARTASILPEPRPFVLQTALSDFYVNYQINAYCADASRMAAIYSELHQNIQDEFNAAGLEIMSPHYSALRDGNTVTIPEPFRGESYRPPAFRIEKT